MDTATAKEEDQAIGEFESEGKTVLPVMIDRHVVGLIAVADTIRGNSRDDDRATQATRNQDRHDHR